MSNIRCNARLKVRTAVRVRSGVAGSPPTPWTMSDVEVLDNDFNKAVLNVPNGMVLDPDREYDCVLDAATFYKDRASVSIITAVPAPALK
jgi:hypothetical protein